MWNVRLVPSRCRRCTRWVATLAVFALLLPAAATAAAQPAPARIAALGRGVSLTGWFRFPASSDPAVLRSWLSDSAMAELRRAGFTFVRLAVQPEFVGEDARRQAVLVEAIRRLQRQGLAVVIDAHPSAWHLEDRAEDRQALLDFWRSLTPALRRLPPGLTFPELLNEPVFAGQDAAWQALQHAALDIVRTALPDDTVVLTGGDWGSVAGLPRLRPEGDPNVIYSFHFYDPAELTSLAAYRPDVRHADLARLPFPVDDPAACRRVADASPDPSTAGLMRFYCSLGWDGARVAARIQAAADWGRRNHAAVWLGEFGASARLNPPARLAWLRAVRKACATQGIGWTLWGYDDVMGFGVPRPPGPHPVLDWGVLRALGLGAPG
jgi:endoglucanase